MACIIYDVDLSKEQKEFIRRDLIITIPGDNYKQGYTFNFFQYENNYWKIPYLYSTFLTGKYLNANIKFPIIPFNFKGEVKDYQKTKLDEANKLLDSYGCCLLNFSTGFGKTFTAIKLSHERRMITLILITGSTKLLEQWYEAIKQFTDADVMKFGDKTNKQRTVLPNIILWMSTSIHHLPNEWIQYIGVLIVDEAHMFCNQSNINGLLYAIPRYVILLTATVKREDKSDIMLSYIVGNKIISAYKKKVNNFILANTGIKYELIGSNNEIWNELINAQFNDKNRQNMIAILAKNLVLLGKMVILFCNRVSSADEYYNMFINTDIPVGKMYGKIKSLDECKLLIGTDKKMGTGFDESTLNTYFENRKFDTMIITFTMKSSTKFIQIIGRTRVDEPIIYQIIDEVKTCHRHWSVCKTTLNKLSTESNGMVSYTESNYYLPSILSS